MTIRAKSLDDACNRARNDEQDQDIDDIQCQAKAMLEPMGRNRRSDCTSQERGKD